jgi:guanylate kinase
VLRPSQKIVIICGPSGVGKSSICAHLLKSFPDRLQLSISETTRPMRPGEVNGREYGFVSQEVFQERILRFHYYEWFSVHGNFYGTPRAQLNRMFAKRVIPLLDIDIQGKNRISKLFPEHLSIFVSPPDLEALRIRLLGRSTDSLEVIENRIKMAEQEMKEASQFHHRVVNQELDQACATVTKLVADYVNGG